MRIAMALALSCVSMASVVSAQESGATVSASIAATNVDSRTEITFSGAFGYRFTRTVGLELEATVVPSLKSPFPGVAVQNFSTVTGAVTGTSAAAVVQVFPGLSFEHPSGRLILMSNNIRVEIPTTTPTLTPYFVAGSGVANVRRTADLTIPSPVPLTAAIPVPIRPPIVEPIAQSETDLALTLGGGLAIRAASHVSIDADLRFFRLLGDQDRNVGRFGVGVRYRF